MGATLGWARFLLASTSEEGIESSDGDIEVVGTSGEVETVDGIDEGVEASGEAEAMDVSVEGAQVSVAEGEELVVVKDCHLEPNLMLVALQERQEASRLPEEFISEVADAVIKVQHSSVVAKKDNNPEDTASTTDGEASVEQKKRKKVKTEYVLSGYDLDFILSYEDDVVEIFSEDMLKDQAMIQQQIENFGYGFLHSWREVILTDSEDEEEDDPVSDDVEEEDDFFTDDDDDQRNVWMKGIVAGVRLHRRPEGCPSGLVDGAFSTVLDGRSSSPPVDGGGIEAAAPPICCGGSAMATPRPVSPAAAVGGARRLPPLRRLAS
uniref:Uncharacterized protein n=1 Tax=Oryza punctata TaxID=4537 RepID=A0A0E0MHI7_ORYPU